MKPLPTDFNEVQRIKESLEDEYQARHQDFAKLRRYWSTGSLGEEESANSLASIFRDLTRSRSDTGPDMRVVHNVIQSVCVKYQTYLSPLPMIRVYTDGEQTERKRAQATKKERYLYGTWAAGQMSQVLNRVAWF